VKYLLVVVVFVTGCMPYVIPPVTGNLGATYSSERASRTSLHVDAGLSPVQLVRGQTHRRWDATVSGSLDRESSNVWGAAVAAGPIFHPWGKLDEERTARVLPQLVGRWTTEGRAVGVRFGVERAAFVVPDESKDGSHWGELGFGLYAEVDYMRPDDMRGDTRWMFTVGLSVRLPVMAGVACCISYR
jgi:hypothetical protein